MVVKLQEKKTVIFTVFAQLECKPEWAEPMVRAKVQYTATGLDLKPDGWLFPAPGRATSARTWLFAGPTSQEDVMVVKLQEKKTVIFTVFAQVECKPEWAEPMVRATVQWTATGEYLKPDGWLFPAGGRLYLRSLEEYVLMEMEAQRLGGPHVELIFLGRYLRSLEEYVLMEMEAQRLGGPHVELIFLGRAHEMISKQSPLWDPRAKVAKPKMRVWGKQSPPECALLSKVSKR
eukprot:s3366_g2.t1